ncbi:hypothetical protein [Mangrovihabitans endophyticus]|uniref:Clumping factor A n=1 Tax=Mangrovihabitans endophyticus TaxID=1751298 RepID=A0A8J3BRI7_9ACTN|nr:hypothetical protein [Mangrovihabitans endophyticus]GGK70651.1 hypothetical protein GCM10012284_00620 [Mangrovihabitans endophyticus]
MIVVSLLLILVAVGLLVLGLAGGSSALLISSIVASLLAAVALVVGARQAAAASDRRSAPTPAGEDGFATFPAADEAPPAVREPDVTQSFDPAAYRGDESVGAEQAVPIAETDQPAGDLSHSDADSGDSDDYPDEADRRADADRAAPDYARATEFIGSARSDEPTADAAEAEPSPEGENVDEGRAASSSPTTGEFAAVTGEDPDDEPSPQVVQPNDAVRVARMDAEVLVVDGRPRYHVAGCPHLDGRAGEPLPAAEAVELGFSPCGLCRPVDRLMSAAEAGRH